MNEDNTLNYGLNAHGFNSPTAGSIFGNSTLTTTPSSAYAGPAIATHTPTVAVPTPGIAGATEQQPNPLFATVPNAPTTPTVTHITTPTATHTVVSTPTAPTTPAATYIPPTGTINIGTATAPNLINASDGTPYVAPGTGDGTGGTAGTGDTTAGAIFNPPTYAGTDYDTAAAAADAQSQSEANANDDPSTIQNNVLSQFQAEIDATNQIYNSKLEAAQGINANRLGSNAAVQARTGLLGSTFGASDTDNINTENQGDIDAVNNERTAALATITNAASAQSAAQIAAAQQAKDAGVDAHLNYLKAQQTEKGTNANTLAQAFVDQGIDPSSIPASQLATYASQYGVGVPDVMSAYAPLKTAADQKTATDAATLAATQATAAKDAASAASIAGEGDGDITDEQQSYATNVLSGNMTMAQVPVADRGNVSQILANAPSGSYAPLASSRFANAATKIAANYIALPAYQLAANGAPYLQRISAAIANPGSISDQDLLDSITKLNTAGGALSDAQTKTITEGKSYADMIGTFVNKLGNGGVLSDSQRSQIQALATAEYANYKAAYEPVYSQVTSQFQAAGIPQAFWTIPDLDTLNTTGSPSDSSDDSSSDDNGSDFGWNG